MGCAANVPRPIALQSGWQLQDAARCGASGFLISQTGYETTGWNNATVPGTVLTSLVDDGIYPEPLYGENNRPDKIPESLSRTSYWYRTEFNIPARFAGKHIWLNFDGINYAAEVWVNGWKIGEIHGAFARGMFDITDFVDPGQQAAVAVRIFPPPHPGVHAEKTQQAGTGPNGGILAGDGPTFLSTIGWDWIPTIRDRDIGIWQTVFLSATGPVVLRDPLITTDLPLPRTDSAELNVQTTVRNVTDALLSGELAGSAAGQPFSVPVVLGPHETRLISVPPLHVSNPPLWWPNGYGPQNLCNLHLSFQIDGETTDARDIAFGIRKITYQIPGSDNLAICVNGVPIFCKGGDWGIDEAMKRSPRDRLEAQIRLHALANYTMIRNWVGQSTSEDFYDLCDRYGILIWDEFFQPNPSDGPNPPDTDLYLANVREKVLRFRNHPSIALWCGRNEGNPPPDIDAGIKAIMSEFEPTRLYQPSSTDGRGVRSGGPYSWRTPREFYNFRPAEVFKTELGSVSVPTLQAIHAMMPEKDWNSINDDWAEHDLTRGAQEGRRAPLYPQILSTRYGPLLNLPDFVRKAQLANYEAYRAMYEGRQAKLFHPVTAVLTWMSNPAQPSFVWQIYSHDLEPNASLFAVRKACEPVHIQMNQSDFHVMVINNLPAALNGCRAEVRIFNLDGTLAQARKVAVNAAGSCATDLGAIRFPAGLTAVHFVNLELRDRWNNLISENFYWRADPGHPDDFTPLNDLPTVRLQTEIKRRDGIGTCRLEVWLYNPTNSVALMAHLQLRRQSSNQRVLPVYYSDNYVSLVPGSAKSIFVEAAEKDLAGDEPLVVLDGWNITTVARSFPCGAAIAPDAEAQIDAVPQTGFK
jgi:glycosyl hydrolase family 2/Ig-like domain-containing protein